jgi:hypothetical protein
MVKSHGRERCGKGTEMYQVWIKKTNKSEPPFNCRKAKDDIETGRTSKSRTSLAGACLLARWYPASGVSLIRAPINMEPVATMIREKHKQRPREAHSIEALQGTSL